MEQLNLEETTLNISVTPENLEDDKPKEEPCLKISLPKKNKKADTAKILSLLGIIFTLLIFPGIFFSVTALILSIKGKKTANGADYNSSFKLSLLGACLNLITLLSFIIFLVI